MTFSRQTIYATAFLRRHLPFMAAWDLAGTRKWVGWFMAHRRALLLYRGRRLVGVTLLRLVDRPEQANDPFADTGGRVAYIDVSACVGGTLPAMFQFFRQAFPIADTMAWVRSKYHNRPFTIPMHRAAARFV